LGLARIYQVYIYIYTEGSGLGWLGNIKYIYISLGIWLGLARV